MSSWSTSLKSVLLPDAFQIHCILILDLKASFFSLTSKKNYNKNHLILNQNRVDWASGFMGLIVPDCLGVPPKKKKKRGGKLLASSLLPLSLEL